MENIHCAFHYFRTQNYCQHNELFSKSNDNILYIHELSILLLIVT